MQNWSLVIFLFLICSIISFNHVYAESSSINIENTFYEKSDIISIWGTSPPNPQNSVFITIKDSNGDTVWTEKLSLDEHVVDILTDKTFEIDAILDAKTESFENKERAKLILAQIHDKLNPNNE